ncbi:hypothetical protein BLA23254_03507 [Burkholderia lata]|uniref:Methyltransferase type 11 domain-containing protein n=2 Tax=Burkholderia lata (strain ATCC 17760 / DSM 23089 / LMG 22485 / NCIMB 9086 / R18194 / 383) TaxID=482957 RepID=A0A6P2M7E8_BURL3|nr:hypothetical protein BLA23254_03507 [Burkholderia lata]
MTACQRMIESSGHTLWTDTMQKLQWSSGIDNEIEFWSKWLDTKGGSWPEDFQFRINPDTEVHPWMAELLSGVPNPKILDVGAGPMTVLGKKMNGMPLDITAVDALGDRYSRLDFPSGLPLIKTRQCESECLTTMFPANTFDLTYAKNTLDHSYNPVEAFRQMVAVTKPGGFIATEHAANEALNENWEGFHQWNFHVDGRDFLISNRSETFSICREIEGLATIETLSPDRADYIGCVMRKL